LFRDHSREFDARADVELAECLAQVMRDRVLADVHATRYLVVGQPLGDKL
jgi:hypothetical protein